MVVTTQSERRWRIKPSPHVLLNGEHASVPPFPSSMMRLNTSVRSSETMSAQHQLRIPSRSEPTWSPFHLRGTPSSQATKKSTTRTPKTRAARAAPPAFNDDPSPNTFFDDSGRYLRSTATLKFPELPVWAGRPPAVPTVASTDDLD